jgi:hypothetical protein
MAGAVGPAGGPCAQCIAGKYQEDAGELTCVLCPADFYSPTVRPLSLSPPPPSLSLSLSFSLFLSLSLSLYLSLSLSPLPRSLSLSRSRAN